MTGANKKPAVGDTVSVSSGWIKHHAKWTSLQHARVQMVVKIPLPGMSLRDLSRLQVGDVVESQWLAVEEVPLFAAGVTLSWCEFAVVREAMAARLTRLG